MAPLKKQKYLTPSLEEVAAVLQAGLVSNFAEVKVEVVDCPDLTQKPFNLSAEGLSGSPRLADVGGVPYLVPIPQTNKIYDLKKVADQAELPQGFVIGPGAGPCHVVGVNSELIANIKCGDTVKNNTHIAKIVEGGKYVLEKIPQSTEFCLMGNFFISEGKRGKVLKISCKKRTGEENFVTCMRKILQTKYGDQPVGLGGVFLLQKGKAKLHVMPTFSSCPLLSDEDVNKWLKFYNMSAPLICLGVFSSCDPGLDLRIEHTHCFSEHGDGGHYHYDTTPDEVEYVGYYNIAEYMYRIDAPVVTHSFGRD